MYKLIRESDDVLLGYFNYSDFREFVDVLSYRCVGIYYDPEYLCDVHKIIVYC